MAKILHNGRGTLVIERKFGKIKIRRASGTTDERTFKAIVGMLDGFAFSNQENVLKAVQAGVISPVDLYQKVQRNEPFSFLNVPENPHTQKSILIKDAIPPFLQSAQQNHSKPYFRDLSQNLNRLLEQFPSAAVSDLAEIVRVFKKQHERDKTYIYFHTFRSSVLALARYIEGEESVEWEKVRQIRRFKRAVYSKKSRTRRPFTTHDAFGIRGALNATYEGAGEVFWVLCITGMRPSEYWGNKNIWKVMPEFVRIEGEKSGNARRSIPKVERLYARPSLHPSPTFSYWTYTKFFSEYIRKWHGKGYYALYDCRRSFAHWMEMAGIVPTHRQIYMGHGAANLTEYYGRRTNEDVPTREIKKDAIKLREYIQTSAGEISDEMGDEPPQTKTLTPLRPIFKK